MSRRVTRTYAAAMLFVTPIVRWWGRLRVTGLDLLDKPGAIVMMANHDSMWDPLVVGVAARGTQVHALAKASLWSNPIVGRILNGMGQIPIERGRGDADALATAISRLDQGTCIGVFPEGTISRGREMRALSGAGRLALASPSSRIVAVSITGGVDIVRFPRRPRITVDFFEPSGGQAAEGESAITLTRRVMEEIRDRAPAAVAGRKGSKRAAATPLDGSGNPIVD